MLKKLIHTSRPLTGVFAALLVVIGFRYYTSAPWVLVATTAIGFIGITWSIMSFNDWVDRFHDRKKGKNFASENSETLIKYLWVLGFITALMLIVAALIDYRVALFCMGIWAIGLVYSYLPHWYIVNNLIVAACSGSPVLVGMIHTGTFTKEPISLFGTFFFLVLIREVYKDMEDRRIDKGYKATMPVRIGNLPSALHLTLPTLGWIACLVTYGNIWVFLPSFLGGGSQWFHAMIMLEAFKSPNVMPSSLPMAKRVLDWIIRILLIVILIVQ